ncbi:MAG: sialate O-acetylesterase, partial [Butyrivibrio sp.]|nr:sialate O-acetylesterase [Butyrivibrio sp.]
MSSLKLSRLLSDRAVIQRRKSIHIWGWDVSKASVTIKFENDIVTTICDENGRFDAYLPARESGGPYTLVVSDDAGNVAVVKDILVGLVWLCSGQSNMELPIARTRDRYPEIIDCEDNDHIRTFKVVEETNYKAPNEEHNTGSWSGVCRETIMDFSATAYFFAAKLQRLTGQPIGLINVSLGGSRIQSWMSREMLEGYDDLLEIADKYADDDFRE